MKRVIIVDDNLFFLDGMKTILTNIFAEKISDVITFQDGRECIAYVAENKADIIFMDYDMPGITGDKTIKEIRDNNRFVKIVAVSMHNSIENITRMIEAGAEDYIVKDQLNVDDLRKYFD